MKTLNIQQSFELAIKKIFYAQHTRYLILVTAFAAITSNTVAQMFEKVEQLTFGGSANAPVKVDVMRTGDTFSFYALNESQFLYEIEIKFSEFYNLRPQVGVQTLTLRPGRNSLFNVEIVNKNAAPRYSYSTRIRLSPELATMVDEKFPYLVPLKKGSAVKYFRMGDENNIRVLGALETTPQDTVRAMRKGVITATPEFAMEGNRLSNNAIEILHPDGSVAIYENLNATGICKYGDRVLPGQPLGWLPEGRPLVARVFRYTEGNRFKSFDYLVAIGDRETVPSSQLKEGWTVVHPVPVVVKELTKREAKRLEP